MAHSKKRLLLLVALAASAALAQDPAASPMFDAATLSRDCAASVSTALAASSGALAPRVREAYLAWSEKTVLAELARAGETLSDTCLAEARRDPVLRDAAFGSVYPPDPSILQNYDELRRALGEKLIERYRSLAIAVSV